MKIKKAIITAAAPDQRKLPLQTLVDRDRTKKTVLEILINEIRSAGIDEIGIVIQPEDEKSFEQALGAVSGQGIRFIPQSKDKPGYGNAILCGNTFLNNEPFLHLVGDHLYVNRHGENVAGQLIKLAEQSNCPVSAVQPTRENLIGNYGTIKAIRMQGETDLFQIKRVTEKPTPAFAELHLMVPGLRAGYYLCFFGMHIFTPQLMEILERNAAATPGARLGLSESLNELAGSSKYLAVIRNESRYDIGLDYGLLKAQLALTLSGKDRETLLAELLQFFVERDMNSNPGTYE